MWEEAHLLPEGKQNGTAIYVQSSHTKKKISETDVGTEIHPPGKWKYFLLFCTIPYREYYR